MDDTLFTRSKDGKLYEGPLGENSDNIKLLFVMKEPNGDDLNCFWMKEKVITRKEGTKYYNVLGAFAKSFINVNTHEVALERSAYINLYPFDGKSEAIPNSETGKSYIDLINDVNVWKNVRKLDVAEPIFKGCTKKQILCNRLKIIKDALENNISVVVHFEIADMIVNCSILSNCFEKKDIKKEKYHISSFRYKDKKSKLYAIPHPASMLKYSELEKILNTTIYP